MCNVIGVAQRVEIDPQFQLYRRLSAFEIPPSLSKAFGASKVLIVTNEASVATYADLAKAWSRDGVETVEWARTLPGSNGDVGLIGCSYVGGTVENTATRLGPASGVKAVISQSTPADLYREYMTAGIPTVAIPGSVVVEGATMGARPGPIEFFAKNYADVLAFSAAARDLGLDQSSEYQTTMRWLRERTLAGLLRRRLESESTAVTGAEIGVIVSDSFGRPWRQGTTDVAIGVSGIRPLLDLRGERDAAGYELHATMIAVADELAAAAELVLGKTSGIPAAVIRGAAFAGEGSARDLVMPAERDLFR